MKLRSRLFALGFLSTTLLTGITLPPLAGVASAAVPVVFGSSWDAPSGSLQNIMNAEYGFQNINCTTDYIGAHAGDPDPFYWTGAGFSTLLIREVAGHRDNNTLGWYLETGGMPTIDGIDDGVVFPGPVSDGFVAVVNLSSSAVPFGFYMNPNGAFGATNAPEPEKFFTNRLWNDIGPNGIGAAPHAPFDGDVQAIVFDVSQYRSPNTWLVCFEDLDSGAVPGPCCGTTDNDFNDLVFEVTVLGPVPVQAATISQIKAMYR